MNILIDPGITAIKQENDGFTRVSFFIICSISVKYSILYFVQ